MDRFILVSFEGYYFMGMNDGVLELVDRPNMAKEFATELDAVQCMMQLGINEVRFSVVPRKEHMELYEKIRPSWIEG